MLQVIHADMPTIWPGWVSTAVRVRNTVGVEAWGVLKHQGTAKDDGEDLWQLWPSAPTTPPGLVTASDMLQVIHADTPKFCANFVSTAVRVRNSEGVEWCGVLRYQRQGAVRLNFTSS